MDKLPSIKNITNEAYYINTLNDTIDSAFKMLADDFGDKLINFEQLHIAESKFYKYDPQLMDQFAADLDLVLYKNKIQIKTSTKDSISNHINNLKSLNM